MRAVRATGYSQLVQVWGVPVSSKTAVETMLGERAFASVRHVGLRIERKDVRKRLPVLPDELAALPEAARHFVIEAAGYYENAVAEVMFARFAALRCASLTISGVTVERGSKQVRTTDLACASVGRLAGAAL